MCGIVGYIGKNDAAPILINGLTSLEYRGYDSAGIALMDNNAIKVFKEKGRVKNILENNQINIKSTMGIAHTRWATHGAPSKRNAHPHMDNSEEFAVVHNGIIENYLELKDFLVSKGYHFDSDTDSEVIPNLMHYYYKETNDVLTSLAKSIKVLKGSFAILVMSVKSNYILAAKMNSPLVIGEGVQENFLASDVPAILDYTQDVYFMDDGDIAVIEANSINFYNFELKEIKKKKHIIDWDKNAVDKQGHADYMLKEIHEQPNAIKETLAGRISLQSKCSFIDLDIKKEYLDNINKIYIVACGTAMHAGKVGKVAVENLCKIATHVMAASEFRYGNPLVDANTLCIFISQSGETADTIAALKLAKEKKAKTIAITNVIGSSITREAEHVIFTHAGPEIAVASTKAYVSQVAIIVTLAIYLAEIMNTSDDKILWELKKELLEFPNKINDILSMENQIKEIAQKLSKEKNMFYIGRGNDYNTALEGSLKLKEIAYIHSEAYPAGELKHGPIALIEKGSYVVGIITDSNLYSKTLSNLEEVITRGANVILVTNEAIHGKGMNIINIPESNPILSPILAIVPLQLLAYYVSKEKGLDVDKPRNLAKSVTVE